MLRNFLLVGIGGAAGSMLRYGISWLLPRGMHGFPWSTFLTNIAGCFLIGLLAGMMPGNHWLRRTGWFLLGTGLCGGFTTFSSFALESIVLTQEGMSLKAAAYLIASIGIGLVFCLAGYAAALRMN
ncbi:MAG: fluoride efflux transporter CrcB [Bacteroidetes bacterium]|nr:fluoride efflux transporter CrcB [Bacteroidota bacterium]MBS1629238.1 fluoride efflux transporter CrcB [Bacteroidota bacterium]